MYKIVERISNVSGVKTYNEQVYYTVEDQLIKGGDEIVSGVEGYSFWFINGGIYCFDKDGCRFYYKGGVVDEIKFPLFTGSVFSEKVFCKSQFVRRNRKWEWFLGVFDFNSMSLERELELKNFKVLFVENKIAVGKDFSGQLVGLDLVNELYVWSIKFGVEKLLGVYKESLLFATENNTIILVDVNSGDITYEWSELPGFDAGPDYRSKIPSVTSFVLDVDSDVLIGVFYTYYFEIDLLTKRISFYQLIDELSKFGISDFRPFNNNPFSRMHFFLTTHTYIEGFPKVVFSSVIALNRKSKQIDWCHTFTENGLGTNIPCITSTHLYQKDLDNNLHIFERQN